MKHSTLISDNKQTSNTITIAVPKGRLSEKIFLYFAKTAGIRFNYNDRTLIVENKTHNIKILLVKNNDLPEYVNAGIAHLGIIGSDVLYENNHSFLSLGQFPFGQTRICLISTKNQIPLDSLTNVKVASKYVKYTTAFLHSRGIQAEIIYLQGSVELTPLLGLAPYIVDLVETGNTIKENGLVIVEEIGTTQVQCIANRALYKLNYQVIDQLIRKLNI